MRYDYLCPNINFSFHSTEYRNWYWMSYELKNLKRPWFKFKKKVHKARNGWKISIGKYCDGCLEYFKEINLDPRSKGMLIRGEKKVITEIFNAIIDWQCKKYRSEEILKLCHNKMRMNEAGVNKIQKTEDILESWI